MTLLNSRVSDMISANIVLDEAESEVRDETSDEEYSRASGDLFGLPEGVGALSVASGEEGAGVVASSSSNLPEDRLEKFREVLSSSDEVISRIEKELAE